MVRMAPRIGPIQGVQPNAKSQSQNIGRKRSAAFKGGVKPHIARQPGPSPETRDEQPEDDNDHPAHDVQLVAVAEQQLAQRGRACAKQDEDCRESEDEIEAQRQCFQPLQDPAASFYANGALPRHVRDIAGHQRQYAGRKEGDGPSRKRRQHADVGDFRHSDYLAPWRGAARLTSVSLLGRSYPAEQSVPSRRAGSGRRR